MIYSSCVCAKHGSINVAPDEESKRIILDTYYRGQESNSPLSSLSISFEDAKCLVKALLDVTKEAERRAVCQKIARGLCRPQSARMSLRIPLN